MSSQTYKTIQQATAGLDPNSSAYQNALKNFRKNDFGTFKLRTAKEALKIDDEGSAPSVFDTKQAQTFNILKQYPWTLSNLTDRDDLPYIALTEHRINQNMLQRQALFYGRGVLQTGAQILGTATTLAQGINPLTVISNMAVKSEIGKQNILQVYEEIYPDNPTNINYIFPYFSKTQFELNTPQWTKVDGMQEELGKIMSGIANVAKRAEVPEVGDVIMGIKEGMDVGIDLGRAALKTQYPYVGITDRPRIFAEHGERSITISFPLYNTRSEYDWIQNYRFYYVFASQNMFLKRDWITGYPPVFYRVRIPGQYFSFASCVTNISIENLGNVRMDYGSFIVPDAYQVTITLTELLMPSLNQFQAVITGDDARKVNVVP
jgi:hypothetical protein